MDFIQHSLNSSCWGHKTTRWTTFDPLPRGLGRGH